MKIANVFLMLCIINILWKDFKYVYGDGDGRRETGVAEDENIEIRGGTGQTREVEEEMIWRDSASSRYGRISEESDTDSDATSGDVQRFAPDDDYEADDDSENVGLEQQHDAESLVRAFRALSNPSSRYGRISEESDTDSDADSGDAQRFAPDDDVGSLYEYSMDDASIWHGSSEENDTNSDAASGDVQRFAPDDDYESEDDSENVGLEQQPDAESLVRASRTLSNPSVADFVEEIDTEGNTNHNQEQQHTVPTVCVVVQETIHEIADSVAEVPELHRRDHQEMFVPFC